MRDRQDQERTTAGDRWHDLGLVFTTRYGIALSAGNVRRDFRKALATAGGVDPGQWTPRELRHSFVSLLSDNFVSLLSDNKIPLERISLLVGHKSTVVTELAYREQIRPVPQDGAAVMDEIFSAHDDS